MVNKFSCIRHRNYNLNSMKVKRVVSVIYMLQQTQTALAIMLIVSDIKITKLTSVVVKLVVSVIEITT